MKKFSVPKIVILVACVMGVIGLFLPYTKSIGEYRDNLKSNPDTIVAKEVNFKASDVMDISIMEYFKMYKYEMSHSSDEWTKGTSTVNVVITIALIAFIILTLVFALLNKPILTIIFTVLMGISSGLMNYDIVDRGVIPSSTYTYGLTYYLYIALAIVILVSSILIIIKNKKTKKNAK